jgi:hypothetical protein
MYASYVHFAMHAAHLPAAALQAVPANLARYGLSQIINHLLALGEPPLGPPPVSMAPRFG